MFNQLFPAVLHRPVRPIACAIFMLVLFIGSAFPLLAQDHEHAGMHAADSVEVVQTVERFREALGAYPGEEVEDVRARHYVVAEPCIN